MAASLTYKGRLPGVVCNASLPGRGEDPLLLDVAAFVGFSERGPLNTPIMLEEPGQYRTLFGGDLLVARDGGRPVYAQLPRAVQSFFDNGGRRCYAVRVAMEVEEGQRSHYVDRVGVIGEDEHVVRVLKEGARPNYFELQGLVAWDSRLELLTGVVAPAAWVGRWSDTMSVGAQLRELPLRATLFHPETAMLDLELPRDVSLQAGALLRVRFKSGGLPVLLMPVATVQRRGEAAATTRGVPVSAVSERASVLAYFDGASSPAELLPFAFYRNLDGNGLPVVALAGDFEIEQVDLLTFDISVREGDTTQETMIDLGFNPGRNFWAEQLAQQQDGSPAGPASLFSGRSMRLRAPVEALSENKPVYFPWNMPEILESNGYRAALDEVVGEAATSPVEALPDKDGLGVFDPEAVFLDRKLARKGSRDLLNEAQRLLYMSDSPQNLKKLHSLIAVEEVGIVSIPDAVHLGWGPPIPLPPDPVPPQLPRPPEDWSKFQGCVPPVPASPPEPGLPDYAVCYEPGSPPERIRGEAPGTGDTREDLREQLSKMPVLKQTIEYDPTPLLNVQRAMITLCRARADMVAVLSLPQHYKRTEIADWQRAIMGVGPYGGLDSETALSYAAVYHPWTVYREENSPELDPLRATAPDGAVCGMIAARELARGPWIAAANVPLRGVVDLSPTLSRDDMLDLFDRHLNLLRHLPGQFTATSAHTLSPDPSLVQLSVRRLLIYLRKLALLRGQRYVFESNNERFRQRVQTAFERTLSTLAGRGAVAAYQVVTGTDLNTPNDVDNGRFIVALKVAPTLPIEFITVVLLRSGEGLLEAFER